MMGMKCKCVKLLDNISGELALKDELQANSSNNMSRRSPWEIRVELEQKKDLERFRKDLRYSYRHSALNMFGKRPEELNRGEVRIILEEILERHYPLRPYLVSERSAFLDLLRKTFKEEIAFMKGEK